MRRSPHLKLTMRAKSLPVNGRALSLMVLDFLLAAQCGPDPAETQRRLADLAEAVEAFEPRTPAERRMRC